MPLSLLLLGVCWTKRKEEEEEDVCRTGKGWVIEREGIGLLSKGRDVDVE